MKIRFIFLMITLSLGVQAAANEAEVQDVSGIVRVVRSTPETEIFFVDQKESVIIPTSHPEHNKYLKASMDSIKSKKPVSFQVNPISRRLVSSPKAKASSSEISADGEADGPAPKAKASGFKDIPTDESSK